MLLLLRRCEVDGLQQKVTLEIDLGPVRSPVILRLANLSCYCWRAMSVVGWDERYEQISTLFGCKFHQVTIVFFSSAGISIEQNDGH